ncbi:hypothetical protein EV421DRAFT_2019677 [Armillaria borealis]|uniref:Uncharacterized protein n=1 Tax=Armillaria borealis TaxID=47425 RepID=A0AA39JGS7_9AGAR|nr:hypothetical protein EV421DRAFT_2019677 [Armillaria borealis]
MSATNSTETANMGLAVNTSMLVELLSSWQGTPNTVHNSVNDKGKKRNDSSNQRHGIIHNDAVVTLQSPEDCNSKDTASCSVLQRGTCKQGEQRNLAHDLDIEVVNGVEVLPSDASANRERQCKKLNDGDGRKGSIEERKKQDSNGKRLDGGEKKNDVGKRNNNIVKRGNNDALISNVVSGLAIENTITGFESCGIRVKNIPRNAPENEIVALFTQQGLNKFEFHIVSVKEMPGRNGKQEADIVTNVDVAQALAIGLKGLEFRDERLEFEVGVFNASGAMGALTPRDENTLTISCRAPSDRYVVEYPDIPFCRTKVTELDGRICAGRRVKVEMNQLPPGRVLPNFRPNTIKISNLPDVVLPAIVTDFAQSHLIRPLKPLSFDIDSAIRSLQLHINRIEGVEMQSFNVTSRGDNEAGILSIRTRFNTWDDAKKVHDALLDRRFSYICNSVFWLRIAPQALYTIIIPSGQYRAQENLWKELEGNIKDRKACNIIIRELNGGDYRIQVLGTVKAALGALKLYPQAHLVQKITDAGAFLRSDSRKRTLKLYGEPKAVEKAKAVVMEELERLASLEFTVTLPRPSVGYFVRTGLAAMREVFGEDSVALDIRSAVITVRGGEEVRLHLDNHITESRKMYPTLPNLCRRNRNFSTQTVFTTHVDKRPQEFRYCKTPDYSHERLNCEDARIHNNPAEQERMSEAWLLQQRACLDAELIFAGVAWESSTLTTSYDHLGTVHGGIYADEPDPVPAQPQAAVPPLPNPDVDVFQDIDYLEQVRLLNQVEAHRVAQEQYDQNRREQDRIAAYHAEAMERRRLEQAEQERARRVAQEQYDQNRREQGRIAAEAMERRRLEEAVQEQQRLERVAQRRRQQEAERQRTHHLHQEQVNRDQNERAQQATPRREYLRQQQPPQPAPSEIQAWCCVVM